MPMNLQMFAEEQKSDDQQSGQNQEEENQQNQTEDDKQKEKTFTRDDLAKMIAAEKSKWEKEKEVEIEKQRNEAARLAKLSKDDREKEEEQKRLAKIEEREKNVLRAELRMETIKQLSNEGLPESFVDMVLAEDADQIKENISTVRKSFDNAVEAEVNKRLAQKAPRIGGNSAGTVTKASIMAIKDDDERARAIAENRTLF